jgi:hypothetical protein
MDEREANIRKHPAGVVIQQESPWLLFENPESVQEAMTSHLYSLLLPDSKELPFQSARFIQQRIDEAVAAGKLDSRYNGYYNSRQVEYFDVAQTIAAISGSQMSVTGEADLFADEVVQKIEQLHSNTQDLQTLRSISTGNLGVKFFEFDAVKYQRKEARQLSNTLEHEVTQQQKWLCNQDKQVFSYYYRLAAAHNSRTATAYAAAFTDYFTLQAQQKKFTDLHHRMQLLQYQLYTKPRWTEEEQRNLTGEISSLHMLFEKYLREASEVDVALPAEHTWAAKTFRDYMLNEPVALVSSVTFDFEKLQVFAGQVSQVIGRIVTVNDHCFRKILALQASLSPNAKISMESQV